MLNFLLKKKKLAVCILFLCWTLYFSPFNNVKTWESTLVKTLPKIKKYSYFKIDNGIFEWEMKTSKIRHKNFGKGEQKSTKCRDAFEINWLKWAEYLEERGTVEPMPTLGKVEENRFDERNVKEIKGHHFTKKFRPTLEKIEEANINKKNLGETREEHNRASVRISNSSMLESLFLKDFQNLNNFSLLNKTIYDIWKGKREKLFVKYDLYKILSDFSPSLSEDILASGGRRDTDQTELVSRLERVNGRLPYMSCRLKWYSTQEMQRCLQHKLRDSRKYYHVAFIGDSRLRMILNMLLRLNTELGWSIRTSEVIDVALQDLLGQNADGEFSKYKGNLHITSPHIPRFQLSFTWAPVLTNLAFERLLKTYGVDPNAIISKLKNKTLSEYNNERQKRLWKSRIFTETKPLKGKIHSSRDNGDIATERENVNQREETAVNATASSEQDSSSIEYNNSTNKTTILYTTDESQKKPIYRIPNVKMNTILKPTSLYPNDSRFPNLTYAFSSKTVQEESYVNKTSQRDKSLKFIDRNNSHPLEELSKENKKHARQKKNHNLIADGRRMFHSVMEELKALASAPSEELPDQIYIETGPWELKYIQDNLEMLDKWAVTELRKVYPLLDSLSKRTSVILLLPSPFRLYSPESSYYKKLVQTTELLEYLANGRLHLLPEEVLIWDTILPLKLSAMRDCQRFSAAGIDLHDLPRRYGFDASTFWGCFDRVHDGYEVIREAAQMLFNFMCNGEMNMNKEFCCS